MTDSFARLKLDFASFIGNFETFAKDDLKKNDEERQKLLGEIRVLDDEISSLRTKQAIAGVVGAVGTVAVTVGLCLWLGPFGLVSFYHASNH